MATIFFLALIPFTIYAIIRPDLRGFDGYAYLSQTCGNFVVKDSPYIANLVLNLLPCNILGIKIALFCLFFVSLLGIASLGSLFSPKIGWMAALFSFLGPQLVFEATKFENDQIAIPILVWATYFYYKARLTKQKKYDLCCLALILFASLFWYGAIYFLLAFALTSLVLIIPGLTALTFFYNELVSKIFVPLNKVVEMQAFNGIALLGGLAIGFGLLPNMLYPQVIFFFLLLILQVKFAWMVMPLLAIGVLMLYENKKLDLFKVKKYYVGKEIKGIIVSLAVVLVVVWGIALQGSPPHLYQWQAVEYAIEQSDSGFVYNDWDLGYWIIHKGGTPSQFGGGEQLPFGEGIVLTRREIDCEMLKKFKQLNVYRC